MTVTLSITLSHGVYYMFNRCGSCVAHLIIGIIFARGGVNCCIGRYFQMRQVVIVPQGRKHRIKAIHQHLGTHSLENWLEVCGCNDTIIGNLDMRRSILRESNALQVLDESGGKGAGQRNDEMIGGYEVESHCGTTELTEIPNSKLKGAKSFIDRVHSSLPFERAKSSLHMLLLFPP